MLYVNFISIKLRESICLNPKLKGLFPIMWFLNNAAYLSKGAVLSRSVMSDSATAWTVARQAPLSMGFSRQEYWSGLPCPPPGGLPSPDIEPRPPALQANSLSSEPPGKPKNTGMGGLSLLQGIFLIPEWN